MITTYRKICRKYGLRFQFQEDIDNHKYIEYMVVLPASQNIGCLMNVHTVVNMKDGLIAEFIDNDPILDAEVECPWSEDLGAPIR